LRLHKIAGEERDEGVESIAAALSELEEKIERFKVENLANNDLFTTIVMSATQAANLSENEMRRAKKRKRGIEAEFPGYIANVQLGVGQIHFRRSRCQAVLAWCIGH